MRASRWLVRLCYVEEITKFRFELFFHFEFFRWSWLVFIDSHWFCSWNLFIKLLLMLHIDCKWVEPFLSWLTRPYVNSLIVIFFFFLRKKLSCIASIEWFYRCHFFEKVRLICWCLAIYWIKDIKCLLRQLVFTLLNITKGV